MPIRIAVLMTFAFLLTFLPCRALEQTRALWVTRWDYHSPEDVQRIVENAAELGFNTLLFQVRGNGTAFYYSSYEPWAEELGGTDPGWDPLKTAIELCHIAGLECHAWLNLYPGWQGLEPPLNQDQLYHTHPDWFMVDAFQNRQILNDHYLWLSPTNPNVQEYLLKICKELIQDYHIDGLHLDYCRFPASTYSYDDFSLRLFKQRFKAAPQEKPVSWRQWRQDAVTGLITQIYQFISLQKPHIVLSAAVVRDVHRGKRIYMQDSHGWLARGIIDAIYPMMYVRDSTLFELLLDEHLENSHSRHIYPGIHMNKVDVLDDFLFIVREKQTRGAAFFSYNLLCPGHSTKNPRAEQLKTLWNTPADPAKMPWKTDVRDRIGPVITQVKTIPRTVTPQLTFKIAAHIIDSSGVYDDNTGSDGQGVHLVYGRTWPPANPREIKMKPLDKAKNWFITEKSIPPQKLGLDFRCRIVAWDNFHESAGHPQRNRSYSDVWSLSIINPNESYVDTGHWGPRLWHPSAIELDQHQQVWVNSERDGPVHVLDQLGKPASFSPVRTGIDAQYQHIVIPDDGVAGFARMPEGIMAVACNTDPPMIFRFDSQTGEARPGIAVLYEIQELDADQEGHLFVLEKERTRWHVLDRTGRELNGSPFGNSHSGTDISVLKNGAIVFIGDKSTNSVQCWYGAIEGRRAKYWQTDPLPAVDVGLGKIKIDKNDHAYVSHSQRGIITIFNRAGVPLKHLSQNNLSSLFAPQDIAIDEKNKVLYEIEMVGMGPTKINRWLKKVE